MKQVRFWLRWSRRDLRERWLQVSAIALIIALGTGIYAGLGSATPWRHMSYDESYAKLNMYDLQVELGSENYANGDDLMAAVNSIEHSAWIKQAETRLLAPTLVDVSTDGDTIYVPGQIMGVDVSGGGPKINGIAIKKGRGLEPGDAEQGNAVLEYQFASYYNLPASGTVHLSGDVPLNYVGQGMTPEYFMVIANEVGFKDEANFAVVMIPLETAQALTGRSGMVNDMVLTLTKDADIETIQAEIKNAVAQDLPGISVSFLEPEKDPAYAMLYGDVNSDDQFFKLIAYLFLAGAAFGTFNLASRIVEAQRRQIEIGMALGISPRLLAIRPLLVGIQIAVLGVIFGLGIGLLVSKLFGGMIADLMPMPVWETPFQLDIFVQAAALGIFLPLAATIYPVWRAVRVLPIDAIKTGYLVSKGGGLAPLLARVPLPGKSFLQMPFRNLLRSPRRTLLTLLGIGMAITTLIAMMGMLDSFFGVIDNGEDEFLQDKPRRMIVSLNTFYPLKSEQISAIQNTPELSSIVPVIYVGGELHNGDKSIDVSIEMLDMTNPLWTPTLDEGKRQSDGPGIIISKKAAHDLDVSVGDMITVKHLRREGPVSYPLVETRMKVIGIHANPLRPLSYMDSTQASLMGLDGFANSLYVNPAPGASRGDVQRALFQQPGVASVRPVSAFTETLKAMMNLLIGFMSIVVGAVVVLAFLIAFNSTSINVDERAREIATMFAFGLPIRTVTRMTMIENLITGILGTIVGCGLGYGALLWMMGARLETMLPDVSLPIIIAPLSWLMALVLGVVVVTLTPLLSIRKMARMNLPSTLRVME